MKNTLDLVGKQSNLNTIMMQAADRKATAWGTYYGVEFNGVITSSRQHGMNRQEIITIELNETIEVYGCARNSLVINAGEIEKRTHQLYI